MQHPVSN